MHSQIIKTCCIAVGLALPISVAAQAASGQPSDPGGGRSAVPFYLSAADELPWAPLWMGDLPLGGTNEPTVAVDPTNPLNVAYASLFSLRVSNDGGGTFQPAVGAMVPATHGLCGDPSLAFDSQGRLFWTYLGCIFDDMGNITGIDIFIAQVNPATGTILAGYPVNVTAAVGLPANMGFFHDKEWLAADSFAGSPFVDNLYVVWTEFANPTRVVSTFSTDQGMTWNAVVQHSGGGEGFVWPAHNAVGPNGDVYVAYHSQTGFNGIGELGGNPDGVSGKVFVTRSMNGGATFPQKNLAYGPGQADITYNVQSSTGTIPGTQFWTQGSAGPTVIPDPVNPGNVYVVANDDPDNVHGAGDDADVFIVRSLNNGMVWSAPTRIDSGPGTTFQIMPSAGFDNQTGCIVVHYYDNRNGNTNAKGNFLLDVFATSSTDGGLTFSLDTQINDLAFDPDPGAPQRLPGPPPTTRIGEYNGVTVGGCTAYAVWCGNTLDAMGNPVGQQTIFDSDSCECDVEAPVIDCPGDVTITCGDSTDPEDIGMATATDDCDPDPFIDFIDVVFPTSCPADPIQEVIERLWTATDRCDQSDSCVQLITVEKVVLDLDIKPGSCPNPLNRGSHGVLPVGLLGRADFDITTVVLATVRLSRADCVGGTVAPHEGPPGPHSVLADVGTPFAGEPCDCHELEGDGFIDWSLKFKTDEIVPALELDDLLPGDLVELVVSGELDDGCEFIATDCVLIVPPVAPPGVMALFSNLPGIWIDVYPPDEFRDGGGFETFLRGYDEGTQVTVTAPGVYLHRRFVGWRVDGAIVSRTPAIDLDIWGSTRVVEALYGSTLLPVLTDVERQDSQ